MSKIYAINDDGGSTAIEPVRVQSEELELQRILEKNFDLLLGDQINPEEPRQWLLIKHRMPVPEPDSAEPRSTEGFLFSDQDAIPTFVECKSSADTRSQSEVIGQMIDYAANGYRYWSKDALIEFAQESVKSRNRTLEEALRDLHGTGGQLPEKFFDRLHRNLQEGRLRFVFFLEDSQPGLRNAVDFLNKQLKQSDFFLVDAHLYSSEGRRIVMPALYGHAEEAQQDNRASGDEAAAFCRRWDEASFVPDHRANPDKLKAPFQYLYAQLKGRGFELVWGTGRNTGTFNLRVPAICARSLISVSSKGWLNFNFGGLPDLCREKLKSLVSDELGLTIIPDMNFPGYPITEWGAKVDTLVSNLSRIVAELQPSGNLSNEDRHLAATVESGDSATQPEIVLEVSSENGSIKLLREKDSDEIWSFTVLADQPPSDEMLSGEGQSDGDGLVSEISLIHSFAEAIQVLDEYSWFKLDPLYVHPEYLGPVLAEVRSRGSEAAEQRWWKELERQ